MSKLDSLKTSIREGLDKIQESEAFQQLKHKYEELDEQTKFYIQAGTVLGGCFIVVMTVLMSIASVSSLKSEIDEKEELIGYLQRTSDTLKQLKAQGKRDSNVMAPDTPMTAVVEAAASSSGVNQENIEISDERVGNQTKKTIESLLDIKVARVNIRQLTKFLSDLKTKGGAKGLKVKNLTVDTKGDPSGFLNAHTTVVTYKEK